jgi:hypothetical protein
VTCAVDEISALIPPVRPQLPEPSWTPIEEQLGLRLPRDYKRLVEAYGGGSFDGFLWVLQPFGRAASLDLLCQRSVRLEALRTLRAAGEEVPFGVEDNQEELVPWAITDNGDVCYWVTSSSEDPDRWVTAINEARGPRWSTFDLSASELLLAVLSGSLHVDLFPDDFPSPSPAFEAI